MPHRSADEISKSINRAILERRDTRFTGKLSITTEVNMANGGVTEAIICRVEEREKIIIPKRGR